MFLFDCCQAVVLDTFFIGGIKGGGALHSVCSILLIDLLHIVNAHVCIAHVMRYFSIIGETLHRWGKRFQAIDIFHVISDNCFKHLYSHFFSSI